MENKSWVVAWKLHLLSSAEWSRRKSGTLPMSTCVEWATNGLQLHLTPARRTDRNIFKTYTHTPQHRISCVNDHTVVSKISRWYKETYKETSDLWSAGNFCAHILLYQWGIHFCSVFQIQVMRKYCRESLLKPFWWHKKIWTDQFLVGLIKRPLGRWSRSEIWRSTHSLNWRWH